MSVKKSTQAKDLLEKFTNSLKRTISNSEDLERDRMKDEQMKMAMKNQETARNAAVLMQVLRIY